MYAPQQETDIRQEIKRAIDVVSDPLILAPTSEAEYYQAWQALKKHWRKLKKANPPIVLPKKYPDILEAQAIKKGLWLVKNLSKGSEYHVIDDGLELSCECLLACNQGHCKHIDEVLKHSSPVEAMGWDFDEEEEWVPDTEVVAGDLGVQPDWMVAPVETIVPTPLPLSISEPESQYRAILRGQQKQAFDLALQWFRPGNKSAFLLEGGAGSGKTFTAQQILLAIKEQYPDLPIAACAPTNQAAKVLKEFAAKANLQVDIYTVQSLLHLRVSSPDSNGKKRLNISMKWDKHYLQYGLVLADEASMKGLDLVSRMVVHPRIASESRALVEELELAVFRKDWDSVKSIRKELGKELSTEWRPDITADQILANGEWLAPTLFMGDRAQLPPVSQTESKELEEESPIFKLRDRYQLTEIQRYNGAIGEYAQRIRDTLYTANAPVKVTPGDNLKKMGQEEWIQCAIDSCREFKDDPEGMRILTWKNDRVNELNTIVRRALYGENTAHYLPGERLIAKEQVVLNSDGQTELVMASCQECQIIDSRQVSVNFEGTDIDIYKLTIFPDDGELANVCAVPYESDAFVFLCEYLKRLKAGIKKADALHRSSMWSDYYAILENFNLTPSTSGWMPRLQYSYATTIHQSQGTTRKRVLMDTAKVYEMPKDKFVYRNRLLYVGSTRASDELIIHSRF